MKVLLFVTWICAVVASPAHRTVSDVTWLRHPPLMRDCSVKNQIHGLLKYHIYYIVCVVREERRTNIIKELIYNE